jgi:hypothetical protein
VHAQSNKGRRRINSLASGRSQRTGSVFIQAPPTSKLSTKKSNAERAEAEAEERASEIADKASALFNFAYGLGATFGPILGGVIYDATDFATTSDVFACIALIFSLIYFGLVFAPAIFC